MIYATVELAPYDASWVAGIAIIFLVATLMLLLTVGSATGDTPLAFGVAAIPFALGVVVLAISWIPAYHGYTNWDADQRVEALIENGVDSPVVVGNSFIGDYEGDFSTGQFVQFIDGDQTPNEWHIIFAVGGPENNRSK